MCYVQHCNSIKICNTITKAINGKECIKQRHRNSRNSCTCKYNEFFELSYAIHILIMHFSDRSMIWLPCRQFAKHVIIFVFFFFVIFIFKIYFFEWFATDMVWFSRLFFFSSVCLFVCAVAAIRWCEMMFEFYYLLSIKIIYIEWCVVISFISIGWWNLHGSD